MSEPYQIIKFKDDFKVGMEWPIKQGGQGKIYIASDTSSKKQYILKETICRTEESLTVARKECDLLKKLQHPHIIKYITSGKVTKETKSGHISTVYLVIEKCRFNLLQLLKSSENAASNISALREQDILDIFAQICEGVEAMHTLDPPVAHRDLKLENILIYNYNIDDGKTSVRICDFGSIADYSTNLESKEERIREADMVEKHTTPKYRAPELYNLFQGTKINEKVDIWSLACILYALAFKKEPFDENEKLSILNGKYTIPKNHEYSTGFISLIEWMLNVDPTLRPCIGDVYDYVLELQGKVPEKHATERKSGNGMRPETEKQKEQRLKKEKKKLKQQELKKREKKAAKKTLSAVEQQRADIKARLARRALAQAS